MDKPLAVDIDEAALMCGVSKSTIYNEVARGNLRGRKIGRRTVFLVEELRLWLANSETLGGHAISSAT